MLSSSRDKKGKNEDGNEDENESAYRGGNGGGGAAMRPRVRVTAGRESKSSARLISGMDKKRKKCL